MCACMHPCTHTYHKPTRKKRSLKINNVTGPTGKQTLLSLSPSQALVDLGLNEILRSCSDTPHLVGLLWMSHQPNAQTSTSQHTTLTSSRHPCLRMCGQLWTAEIPSTLTNIEVRRPPSHHSNQHQSCTALDTGPTITMCWCSSAILELCLGRCAIL